jgi:hypothetical protein
MSATKQLNVFVKQAGSCRERKVEKMGKNTAPKDSPNRRTSSTGPVKSKVNKVSRNDGSVDLVGSLAPNQGKRTGKDFSESPPPPKGKRDDSFLGRFDSTRKTDAAGPRNWVRSGDGVDQVERIGDLVETFDQTDAPDELNIP